MEYLIVVAVVVTAIVAIKLVEFLSKKFDNDYPENTNQDKSYELIYNEKALFNPWQIVEVTIEGIGYKKYREIASFDRNEAALSYFNTLSKK